MKLSQYKLKELNSLYSEVRQILEKARASVYRSVNSVMIQTYWHVGRLIVEYEQSGHGRAEYGKAVLEGLAKRLTVEFGQSFNTRNLRYMRQFYLLFINWNALRSKSDSTSTQKLDLLRPELSWTHYRLLLRIEDKKARDWYMHEAAEQNWSTRQLDRQISTLYYERLLASKNKSLVHKEAEDKLAKVQPEEFIRDPYVLEFLNLHDYPALRENTLEAALIDNLQQFLLELGKGFSFVARQKHIRLDDEDFYIDLVFYNYILKCFVLLDLKIGKLTHQDIGQMDSYVRIYEENCKIAGDNPTIGLILCSEHNEAVARYSILHKNKQLFASKYKLQLPTEEELRQELKRDRERIERCVKMQTTTKTGSDK